MGRFLFLLLAVVLPLAACEGPADPTQNVVGTYTLVQLNGSPLPALTSQDAFGRVELVSGTLTLRSDRSFAETLHGRFTPTSGAIQTNTVNNSGTFTVTGSTVRLQSSEGATYSGTLNGNILEYALQGFLLRYHKD
jgi:uncharacterized lipoprotein YajG